MREHLGLALAFSLPLFLPRLLRWPVPRPIRAQAGVALAPAAMFEPLHRAVLPRSISFPRSLPHAKDPYPGTYVEIITAAMGAVESSTGSLCRSVRDEDGLVIQVQGVLSWRGFSKPMRQRLNRCLHESWDAKKWRPTHRLPAYKEHKYCTYKERVSAPPPASAKLQSQPSHCRRVWKNGGGRNIVTYASASQ